MSTPNDSTSLARWAALPDELKARPQWVLWKREPVAGRMTKILYNARAPRWKAKSNDPDTWASFEEAVAALQSRPAMDGVGYVFSDGDPYVGVDLDNCIDEAGEIAAWAREYVELLNTYSEWSQSKKGIHAIAKGQLPPAGRKKGNVEMYSERRFFATTGDHVVGTPPTIEDRAEPILQMHAKVFGVQSEKAKASTNGKHPPRAAVDLQLDDHELLDRARLASNGGRFSDLYDRGDVGIYGDDDSAADLALCNTLAFWFGCDAARMDRVFRGSALYRAEGRAEKWDSTRGGGTYGSQTIQLAIADCREVYSGPGIRVEHGGKVADDRIHDDEREQAADGHGGGDGERDGAADGGQPATTEPRRPLWKSWVLILAKEQATLIWTNTAEAYFQTPDGELFAVHSDAGARWFQARSDREARFQSDRWSRAAGALRSWTEANGNHAVVVHQAKVDFAGKRAWVGCEDGRHLYRVTPAAVELVKNGVDGVLIRDGVAPVLESTDPTGELARWLTHDTWAMPVGKLTLAIFAVMLVLGAQSFPARPLILALGPKGSGKTSRLQMLGGIITGEPAIAQSISARDDQNEVRVVNELLVIFDNMEATPRNSDTPPEDFIAAVCTQQFRSIRRMRVEAEQVKKPITAFLAATSFSTPACLRRSDVIDRSLVVGFEKPEGGRVAEMTDRIPDRAAAWADLLAMLQRVVTGWSTTVDTSDLRAVGFMRIARALLDKDDADAFEKSLLGSQASTAGQDDPILYALSVLQPRSPLSAKDLLSFWAHVFGDDRPKSGAALGQLLKHRQGICGSWLIRGEVDPTENVTLWSFTRTTASEGLNEKRVDQLLKGLTGSSEG